MKKLALALVASTVALSAANANINTGFYLGAAVGYGATTAKATVTPGFQGNNAHGDTAANIGIHAGYGWVQNCTYFGGEVAYTFENTKVNNSLTVTGGTFQQNFKRNGYFGAALRAGYLFTPTTMAYIRLGGNWGKWKLDDNVGGAIPAGTGSKNRFSFTPGFGIETAVHKNVFLRAEYTYEFGPSVSTKNNSSANPRSVTFSRVRSQSAKVGLSYKF